MEHLTDAELVTAYVESRAEEAFEELVSRHGKMDAMGHLPKGFDLQLDATGKYLAYITETGIPIVKLPPAEDLPTVPAGGAAFTDEQLARIQSALAKMETVITLPVDLLKETALGEYGCMPVSGIRRYSHADFRILPGGRGMLFAGRQGAFLMDVSSGAEVARFRRYPDDTWLVSCPNGLCAGTAPLERAGAARRWALDIATSTWKEE